MNQHDARQAVVDIGGRAVGAGLVVGAGGNISARIGTSDELVISPTGYRLEDVDPGELVVIDLDGRPRDGGLRPSSEWAMHVGAFSARPDIDMVIHLHPPFATLLHALDRDIRLITLDHAYYVRQIAHVGFFQSGSSELAQAVVAALAEANVVLMKHHGCVVVADSPDLAYHRVLNLEEAAKATYRALLLGDVDAACPPEYLERVRALEASAGKAVYGQR